MTRAVTDYAISSGWKVEEVKMASTGTCYIELSRRKKVGRRKKGEWVMIRLADHNKVYSSFIKMYSISPSEMSMKAVKKILAKPFGEAGDVLL
jgi:hypothetical protein